MILADKIIKLRRQMGWSQEDLAMHMGVSRQSVSKWESMGSIPDLDKIVKLSQLFGVSTDYLLKDDMEEPGPELLINGHDEPDDINKVHMTLTEANTYMDLAENVSKKIAAAVALCILSPVPVILLGGYAEIGALGLSEDKAGGIGVVILLVMIACAVMTFVSTGMKLNKYEFLEKEILDLEYGIAGIVETKKENYAPIHKQSIMIGVGLCILSVVPILFAATMNVDKMVIAATGLLLIMIAAGVFLFVRTGIIQGSYDKLLEEGDYTVEKKLNSKKNANLSTVYWCTATAIYLGWSFLSGDWHITWIVWPVAGVLFGAVIAVASAIRK